MKETRRLPWELTGAVVGAGLASGREVASFFAQYGLWSWVGIALAVGTLGTLADAGIPTEWQGRLPGRIWRILQTLLLVATGGAMLAGAGEVAALTLPFQSAQVTGMLLTLGVALLLSRRTIGGLAAISRVMLTVLILMIVLGLLLPPMRAVAVEEVSVSAGLIRGIAYGGFNAALQLPILARREGLSKQEKRRSLCRMCLIVGGLLCLCNGTLLRHPALLGEPLPFVRLIVQYGIGGHWLGAAAIWLAILSTLVACLQGLSRGGWAVFGIVLVATAGLTDVVETLYPLLGGGCTLFCILSLLSRRTHTSRRAQT